MLKSHIVLARAQGKLPYRASKNGRTRYTLASSLAHAQSKFAPDWKVEQIDWDEFEMMNSQDDTEAM